MGREERKRRGGEGRDGEGGEGERGGDVEGPEKWSAPGPALALGGPGRGSRAVPRTHFQRAFVTTFEFPGCALG